MILHVVSLDFDNALASWGYLHDLNHGLVSHDMPSDKHPIVLRNAPLQKMIQTENEIRQVYKTITFVGSNRQSIDIDLQYPISDARKLYPHDVKQRHEYIAKASCYPAIRAFAQSLATKQCPSHFDPLLLPDIFHNLVVGEAFRLALLDPIRRKFQHPDAIIDRSKVILLYAQIHKVASEHPNDVIIFDFFDDQDEMVLDKLLLFYGINHDLLPSNALLRLNHYVNGESTTSAPLVIRGTGSIDNNYRETVQQIAQLSGPQTIDEITEINAADNFDVSSLMRDVSGLSAPQVSAEALYQDLMEGESPNSSSASGQMSMLDTESKSPNASSQTAMTDTEGDSPNISSSSSQTSMADHDGLSEPASPSGILPQPHNANSPAFFKPVVAEIMNPRPQKNNLIFK